MESPTIPPEQLERIQPTVSALLHSVRELLPALPYSTDAAVIFRLEGPDDK